MIKFRVSQLKYNASIYIIIYSKRLIFKFTVKTPRQRNSYISQCATFKRRNSTSSLNRMRTFIYQGCDDKSSRLAFLKPFSPTKSLINYSYLIETLSMWVRSRKVFPSLIFWVKIYIPGIQLIPQKNQQTILSEVPVQAWQILTS